MQETDVTGNQDVISALIVASNALPHRASTEENISKSALKVYKELCAVGDKMHNAQMKIVIIHLVTFLNKAMKDDAVRKPATKFIAQEIEKYFTEGIRSSKFTVLFEIVKRHPVRYLFICIYFPILLSCFLGTLC